MLTVFPGQVIWLSENNSQKGRAEENTALTEDSSMVPVTCVGQLTTSLTPVPGPGLYWHYTCL